MRRDLLHVGEGVENVFLPCSLRELLPSFSHPFCLPHVSAGGAGMMSGPTERQTASGRCWSALQLYHERDADNCRSASACLLACPEMHRTCSRSLPIASGFSVPCPARGGVRIPAGSHRPSRNSADRRIIRRRYKATQHDAHSIDHRCRRNSGTRDRKTHV